MKTRLKTLLTAATCLLSRLKYYLRVRGLEILIDGQGKALACVACPLTAGRIELARHFARAELARARAEYGATFPPGVRHVWQMA